MGGGSFRAGTGIVEGNDRKRAATFRKAVNDFAQKFKGKKIEYGWRLNEYGEFEAEFRGTSSTVDIQDADDKATIHWHPDSRTKAEGGPFSVADIRTSILSNECVSFVVDRTRIYYMRPQDWFSGFPSADTSFADAYAVATKKTDIKSCKIVERLIRQGKFTKSDGTIDRAKAKQYVLHLWNNMRVTWLKNNAKKYGFIFGWRNI